jgi:hypothetical protein
MGRLTAESKAAILDAKKQGNPVKKRIDETIDKFSRVQVQLMDANKSFHNLDSARTHVGGMNNPVIDKNSWQTTDAALEAVNKAIVALKQLKFTMDQVPDDNITE